MRKNELIKLLQSIPGNPEVVVWNGHVEDWQPVKSVSKYELVRQKLSEFINWCLWSDRVENPTSELLARLKKSHNKLDWKVPECSEELRTMQKKSVIMIEPGKRNRKDCSRLGDIEY